MKNVPVAVSLSLGLIFSPLSEYLNRWRLKLSTAKTTATAFHLNNLDTYRQLDVVSNGASLPKNNNPVYLGVVLDLSLTYEYISKAPRAKSTSGMFFSAVTGS